ncbi:MAG TPA: OmpA family protein [Rhizomicrobium sp.]|jgi:outer membrane protein OmpA-like peptidoglycan-associated protein
MSFDRFIAAAAIALVGTWCTGAGAQSDSGDGVIHLHMPGQAIHLHPIRHHAPQPATPAQTDEIGAEPAATPETPAAAPAKSMRARQTSEHPAIPFNFGDEGTAATAGAPPAPRGAPPMQTAALPPHPAAPAHASAAEAAHPGLTKHGAVMFTKGAPDPSPAQFNGVKLLASELATALESGGARVELDAYGGAPGDKSSDARRLSLRRALAVRQLLIDNGVPSSRIDVRALGGADDKGPSDRVDVFVRTG